RRSGRILAARARLRTNNCAARAELSAGVARRRAKRSGRLRPQAFGGLDGRPPRAVRDSSADRSRDIRRIPAPPAARAERPRIGLAASADKNGHDPAPWESEEVLTAYFREHPQAVLMCAFLHQSSRLPMVKFTVVPVIPLARSEARK